MGKEKRPENKDANKSLNRKCTNNKFKGSRTVLAHLSSSKKLVIRSDNSCSNECKDGGKMMKDHSMETDFCILRRYCKMKNLKINKKKVFKTQSNYEVNKETVSGSSEKSKTDNSACGDSRRTTPFIINNVEEFNANFAALVINNLNKLLRNWIKNYLFNNDDTKKKIQIILDSMLKKLEAKNDYVSTSSTYTIDIRIRESNTTPLNVETISTTSQSFETKSHSLPENIPKCKAFSSFTVPNPDNNSLISTLSIPKYVHACHHQMTGKNLCYSLSKTKRLYNKNVLLTISKSNGILSDSSSLNFLEISTKSLTKPFATYRDKNMVKRNLKKRRIIFIPSSYCKFPGTTSITHINGEILKRDRLQKEHDTNPPLDAMPSLVKSIFTDDLSNMDSTDECSSLEKKDINTMTEEFIMRKRDEKMKELCENSTNMTPHLTINAAAGNDSVSIVFPRIAPNVSLKRLTLSCENYVSKENVPQCTCKNSKVIKSFSCKACLKATDSKNDSDPPLLTIDFLNKKCNNCCKRQGSNKQELGAKKSAIIHKINSLKKLFAKKQKKCCEVNSKNQSQIDFEKIRHKRFCYKHKKSNNQLHKNDFLNHFQDVFNYFANYKGKRNINLDICINVYPTIETTKRNETICKQICSTYDVRTSESEIVAKDLITNDSDSKLDDPNMKVTHICNCEQKLIPLFDDTINKKKSENINICSNTSRNIQESTLNISNKITTTAELEIAQEVFQLRTIIKDLAVTAEKFVTEHLKNTQLQTDNIKSATEQNIILNNFAECIQSAPNDTTGNNILENVKRSKSTQLTNNISCQKLSGIKTKKDPQNKTAVDIQARLMKKSTSYNIIDSETILKVTDMTSATQTCTFNSVTDEGLTCSLPKCKSLYDISVDSNKNKLMAFYCEELLRKPESENISISAPPIVSSPEPGKHPVKKKSSAKVTPKEKSRTSKHEVDCAECLPVSNNKCANNNISCSSVFINVDDRTNEKKIKIRARRGIGFREGSLCCLILWIPVIVILWLLYIFIIKDKFKPKTFSLDKLSRSLDYAFASNENTMSQQENNYPDIKEKTLKAINSITSSENMLDGEDFMSQNEYYDSDIDANSLNDDSIKSLSSIKTLTQGSYQELHAESVLDESKYNSVSPTFSVKHIEDINVKPNLLPMAAENFKKFMNLSDKFQITKTRKGVKTTHYQFKRSKIMRKVLSKSKKYFLKNNISSTLSLKDVLVSNAKVFSQRRITEKVPAKTDVLNYLSLTSEAESSNPTIISPNAENLGAESLALRKNSLCSVHTIDINRKSPTKIKTEQTQCQGDIVSVNVAQINNRSAFNKYFTNLEFNDNVKFPMNKNHVVTDLINNPPSNLSTTFSMSSSSKKSGFSISSVYNASDVSDTTLTAPNISNILFTNSSSVFNKFCFESNFALRLKDQNATDINDENKHWISRTNDDRSPSKTALNKKISPLTDKFKNFAFAPAESLKIYSQVNKNKGDVAFSSMELQRPHIYLSNAYFARSETSMQNNKYSPKEFNIKLNLSKKENTPKPKRSEQIEPKYSKSELWETLTLVLDNTVQRLEDTLSKKIINEVNKSLTVFSKSIHFPILKKVDKNIKTKMISSKVSLDKRYSDENIKLSNDLTSTMENDECLQCSLVSTSLIDEHVQKLSIEKPPDEWPSKSRTKETKLVIDYLENIKTRTKEHALDVTVRDRGDSPTFLVKNVETGERFDRFRRLKILCRNSIRFLVENALVIISVPSFLFVLFLLYGIIVLTMKPW